MMPSKHVEEEHVNPEMPMFVHDPPEGSVAEQSPRVSALGCGSDASQLALRLVREGVKAYR